MKTVRGTRSTRGRLAGIAFVAPYLAMLLAFGLIPVGYAVVQSFKVAKFGGPTSVGFGNFPKVTGDFRFGPAVTHAALFVLVWLPVMVVGVMALALLLHARIGRFGSAMRLIYFLPGAVTGSAGVLLWLLIVQPQVSPFRPFLHFFGIHSSQQILQDDNLPFLFAIMAFTAGAGNWIVIMYGALQNLSASVLESADLDGCNAWQKARYIKIPGISRYVIYMVLLSFALGTQIFVEPQLFYDLLPGSGVSSPWWSPNQLAYQYFFQQNDFGGAAALSVLLLLVSLAGALLIIFKTKLFETEAPKR